MDIQFDKTEVLIYEKEGKIPAQDTKTERCGFLWLNEETLYYPKYASCEYNNTQYYTTVKTGVGQAEVMNETK